jgi:hypothetical protein
MSLLKESVEKYEKMTTVFVLPGMILLGLIVVYHKPMYLYLEIFFENTMFPRLFYGFTVFFLAVFIPFIAILFGINVAKRKYSVRCKSCNVLIDKSNLNIILSTKNCTNCGDKIID